MNGIINNNQYKLIRINNIARGFGSARFFCFWDGGRCGAIGMDVQRAGRWARWFCLERARRTACGGLSGAGVLVEGRRAGGAAGGAGEAWRGVRDWPSQALREGGAERPRSGLSLQAQGEAQDAPIRAALANGQDSRDLDCPSGCGARWPGEMASSGARGTLAMRLDAGSPVTAGGSIPWGSARIMWGAGNAVCVKRSIFAEMETSDAAV